MIIAYTLTGSVVLSLTIMWFADWIIRSRSNKERTVALLNENERLLAENERLHADNEAYCQNEMTTATELLDLKQQVARLEADPIGTQHPDSLSLLRRQQVEQLNPDFFQNLPVPYRSSSKSTVTDNDRLTNLRLAEDELQKALEALRSRARGTVFGHDTYASLPGKQAAALVEELLKLRSRIKILEDTTAPREPGTP
jgi:hypothetical protein